MHTQDLQNYSDLLLDYCLEVIPGSKLLVQSSTLAEPLIYHLYQGALSRGAIMEFNLAIEGQESVFNQFARKEAVNWVNPTYAMAVQEFDTYLYIRAPFFPSPHFILEKDLAVERRQALAPYQKIYSQRTGDRTLRRSLCQYPTPASAAAAEMPIEEYENFVLNACFLNRNDPINEWKELSAIQRGIVEYLNGCKQIRYINARTDISFSVEGRTWINSDGRTNMPSGEVYSSPEEDSVNGHIFFDYPFLHDQQMVQGVSLTLDYGRVVQAFAEIGNDTLQEILKTPGADHIGEVAIGTNPNIQIPTKNILFDEKMAGTVHMALGQSYLQCGGKNESSVHQDMIADMRDKGQIWADGKLIYESGKFLF